MEKNILPKKFELSEDVENYRDRSWRREETLKIETALQVEAMVEDLGFCLALTDARTNLPSVYIAVCGRRDAHSPKNVQKDYEMSLAWTLKDEVMMRGKVYYGKLCKGRAMFVAPRLVPYFNAIWGVPKSREKNDLSGSANKILEVLRKEWEMGTSDLREEAEIATRPRLNKALDKLQRTMKVIPSEVLYQPRFTYIWTLAEARFPKELSKKVSRQRSGKKTRRKFSRKSAAQPRSANLQRAFGLTRKEAGKANHQLVDEGFAERPATGIYRLK